jgi:phage terminase small subunit
LNQRAALMLTACVLTYCTGIKNIHKINYMKTIDTLHELLKHELKDLYSAEAQIIEALPGMIKKASDKRLKTALKEHLDVTTKQKDRLDNIQEMLG